MPNSDTMTAPLPAEFVARVRTELGTEVDALFAALEGESPVSVRWNPYKTILPPSGEEVPWNRYGRYLPERPYFTADPMFHAGTYYVQEASSMFVEHLLRSAMEPEGARILDMCAAPGGKSTLYATLAGAEGLVVANEVVRSRAATLADNIRKWGIGNVLVSNNDPSHFAGLPEWFDVVAVDAPCSGEGMFRKSEEARREWSEGAGEMCAARQRRILADAWEALRPGGIMIYSTCTFNRAEDEDNVAWLAENFDCEDAGADVPAEWNIAISEAEGIRCFRFWPHRTKGEGFFAAAIRKCGQKGRTVRPKARRTIFTDLTRKETAEAARWTGQPELMRFARIGDTVYGYYDINYADIRCIGEYLNVIYSGVCMGQLFNGSLKPDHSLAMFHDMYPYAATTSALPIESAIRYLAKEELTADMFAEGMNIVTFQGHALGWAKRIGRRVNNLYPKQLAIINK